MVLVLVYVKCVHESSNKNTITAGEFIGREGDERLGNESGK